MWPRFNNFHVQPDVFSCAQTAMISCPLGISSLMRTILLLSFWLWHMNVLRVPCTHSHMYVCALAPIDDVGPELAESRLRIPRLIRS